MAGPGGKIAASPAGWNPDEELPRRDPSEAMRLGWPLFLRLVWRSFIRTRGTQAPLTPRRFLALCLYIPVVAVLQSIHRFFLLLDELLFPAYREIEVRQPVFIVGVARSGTTFLHRLLSDDAARFTTMSLWEGWFAPSITQRKIILGIGRLDRAFASPLRRVLAFLDRVRHEQAGEHHDSGLFSPEEDHFLLLPIFATLDLIFPFPFPEELRHLLYFDREATRREQQSIMEHYRKCVQRHLYVHGTARQYLAKNPTFTSKLEALRRTFPDAKIICNLRTPYETVPSCLSVWEVARKMFGHATHQGAGLELMLESISWYYRHAMACLPRWPADCQAFVPYRDLTREPRCTVLDLYDRFGFRIGEAFDASLAAADARHREFESGHVYSLEQFGLTPERIRADFGEILEFFGFEESPMPGPGP